MRNLKEKQQQPKVSGTAGGEETIPVYLRKYAARNKVTGSLTRSTYTSEAYQCAASILSVATHCGSSVARSLKLSTYSRRRLYILRPIRTSSRSEALHVDEFAFLRVSASNRTCLTFPAVCVYSETHRIIFICG